MESEFTVVVNADGTFYIEHNPTHTKGSVAGPLGIAFISIEQGRCFVARRTDDGNSFRPGTVYEITEHPTRIEGVEG